jgi:hypothetical protein
MQVARSAEEISAARFRAQKVSFAAEDAQAPDEAAEAVYQVLQWVLGDEDTDPTLEMDEDPDGEEE